MTHLTGKNESMPLFLTHSRPKGQTDKNVATKRLKGILKLLQQQVWPMGLLFINSSSVKQYSYENNFSGVFDALHQNVLVILL